MKTRLPAVRKHSSALSVLLLAALLIPQIARSQFGPALPRPLNSTAATDTGGDFSPRIATDRRGHWVAVWSSRENLNGTAGTDADIFVARSTNNGASWSATQTLNSNANTDTGQDFAPQIQTDGTGRWIVVWHSNENLGGTNGTEMDILFAVSTDNGATWSAVRPLNRDAGNDTRADSNPALATDARGNWIASWHASGGGSLGSDQEVWLARSSDGGNSWSAPLPLNNNASSDSGNDFSVSLATDRQGRWLAVWSSTEDLSGPADSDSDIAFAWSVNNGATWSAPAFLHPGAESDDGEDFNPQVSTDRQGRWVTVWESGATLGGTVGSDQDILFARSIDNGNTWSAPGALNASAGTDSRLDSFPSVTTDAAGAWVAIWHSEQNLNNGIGPDQDILVSYSIDHGATWFAVHPLAGNAANDSGDDSFAHVATDESGHWVVAWSSTDDLKGTTGSEGDILSVTVSDPLLWNRPQLLNHNALTDTGNDFSPRLTSDGAGNWIAVWMSNENLNGTAGADFDIFFSRSTNNGVTWSATALLNSNGNTDTGDDRDPRIATDRKGRWIAVWSAPNLAGADTDIIFAVSTNKGATWSAPAALNTTANSDAVSDFSPGLATDRLGNWVVVWGTQGLFGNDFDVMVARSGDGGGTWSQPAPLNTNAANDDGDDFEPQVSTDRNGRWIAVWMSNSELTGLGYNLGTDDDILVAYSADGATWSSPRPLNSNAATDGPDDDDYSPQLATDTAGTWVVVWHSESTLGGTIATNFNILYTRSTNHGVNWSTPVALHSNAAFDDGDDLFPQIATDEAGTWVAVWYSSSRGVGGTPVFPEERDIITAISRDAGATWSPPSPLNTDGFIDANSENNPHLAVGAGGQWIASWSWTTNLLGADTDLRFATVLLPGPVNPGVMPLQISGRTTSAPPGRQFSMNWSGGVAPFQVQSRASLTLGSWANLGAPTCDRSLVVPMTGSQAFFRVLSTGNAQPQLAWAGEAEYLQGGMDAVAETIFVDGFGINDWVNVLVSGALPLTVQRMIVNNSRSTVPAGYLVRIELQGWTFVAVGGQAGYVPGAVTQLVFECETTNTPALAPGQTALIEFTLGGPGCPPLVPIAALSCGLYSETMTVESPTPVPGSCSNIVTEVVDSNFLFVNDASQIRIAATLDPDNDPNASVNINTVSVFAVPDAPVRTHQLNITTVPATLTYFLRGRSPIFGRQAPTQGNFVPAIPQSPAPPLTLTGPAMLDYFVTVIPAYNGIPSCDTLLPPSYQEKVNTTLTAISTNGCAIAQKSVLATGIYECNF